jgi:hypothetical protein
VGTTTTFGSRRFEQMSVSITRVRTTSAKCSACLPECLFGDIEAADRLPVDVTGGGGATALRDRRGPGHADICPNAHGAREADLGLKGRAGGHQAAGGGFIHVPTVRLGEPG